LRALLSVSDREGIIELARGLADAGVECFATDGTRAHLADDGIEVRSVTDLTDSPEILGGRVKTLHPNIFAGLLARRDQPDHLAQLAEHGIEQLDIVVVNLYPFAATVRDGGVSLDQALEKIDIGGVALLRAAAKNFPGVAAVSDKTQYASVLRDLKAQGTVSPETRQKLAAEAFALTAGYDAHIASYLNQQAGLAFPSRLTLVVEKRSDLRYGENPHQSGAFYADPLQTDGSISGARQIAGKDLSFNNLLDLDAAWSIASDFKTPTVTIVKHGNPCGLASVVDLAEAHVRALDYLVGGGASADQMATSLEVVLSDPAVEAVFINIFGGITRCDLVAEGVLGALERVEATVPLVVRLDGTNAEEGRAILAAAAHPRIVPAATMLGAAERAAAIANGAAAYKEYGQAKSRGTMPLQLAGNVRRGGLVERAFGLTIRELLEDYGGGSLSGRPIRAVQIGGPLGAYVPASQFDTPLEYESLAAAGAMLGHGGVVVFDDTVNMLDMARYAMEFCAIESCGKCTPCRIGSTRGAETVDKILRGEKVVQNIDLVKDLCETLRDGSLCALGGLTPMPVMSALEHFPEDFDRKPSRAAAAE